MLTFFRQVSFNITSGNVGDAFAVNASGVVTTIKKLDRETDPSYLLTVREIVTRLLFLCFNNHHFVCLLTKNFNSVLLCLILMLIL